MLDLISLQFSHVFFQNLQEFISLYLSSIQVVSFPELVFQVYSVDRVFLIDSSQHMLSLRIVSNNFSSQERLSLSPKDVLSETFRRRLSKEMSSLSQVLSWGLFIGKV